MIKVEGHKNLFRDENSGAIIDMDKAELDEMKKDINEIKSLLKQLTKQIT